MGVSHYSGPLDLSIDPRQSTSWLARVQEPIDHIGYLLMFHLCLWSIGLTDLTLLLQIRDVPLSVAWTRIWTKSLALPWWHFWDNPMVMLGGFILLNTWGVSFLRTAERNAYDEFKLWLALKSFQYTKSTT